MDLGKERCNFGEEVRTGEETLRVPDSGRGAQTRRGQDVLMKDAPGMETGSSEQARRRGQWAGAQGRRARGGRAVETGAGGARDSFLQDPGEGKAGAAGSGSFLYGAVSVSNDAECPWRACGGFATSVQFCIRILNRVDDEQGWRQREPVVITLTEGPRSPMRVQNASLSGLLGADTMD